MPDQWSLMQERTVGVEIGSVKHPNGAPVPLKARLDEDRLQQKVVCALRPGNETRVRFLDEPNHGKKWEHPFSKELIDGDLEKVSLFSCIFCHRWSSFPIHWDVSMGHVHSGLDQMEQLSVQDRMYEAAGGVAGQFMSIEQTSHEGVEVDNVAIAPVKSGLTNPAFVRTMALINESNLENGIVEIPYEVCVQARLNVYKGVPEPSDDQLTRMMDKLKIEKSDEAKSHLKTRLREEWDKGAKDKELSRCAYAIPIMHVFAAALHSEEWAKSKGVHADMLRFTPKGGEPVALYYIVPEVTYKYILKEWKTPATSPMGKVDTRPLSDICFNLIPFTDTERYPELKDKEKELEGVVAARAYLKYYVPPVGLTPAAIASLAPTLAPGMPSFHNHVSEDERIDNAIQRFHASK
jgi:hypothetical protein